MFALSTVLAATVATAADESSPLTGGGNVSGPPAPAVPAIAATPEPAEKPAVPGAPVEPGAAAREETQVAAKKPRRYFPKIDLWPFLYYESDPVAETSRFQLFGPLLEYRTSADRLWLDFRPLISISQSRVGHDDDVHILYRVMNSHWGDREQTTTALGGLVTYRTQTSEDGRTLESQRARVLPLYFYDWDQSSMFGRVSVAPFYADVDDVFGYDRVQMIMFPAYLHLQRADRDRRYYLFFPVTTETPRTAGHADEAIASLHRTADDLDDVPLQRAELTVPETTERAPLSLLDGAATTDRL